MFECKEAITEAVDRAFEHVAHYERGQLISFETLESATGLIRYGEHWNSFIKRFRRKVFLERRIMMMPERGMGYKLLTRQEQLTRHVEYRRKRELWQNHMAIQGVESLSPDELTDHQRRIQAMQSDALRGERRHIKSGLRQQRLEGRVTQTNPRRSIEVS